MDIIWIYKDIYWISFLDIKLDNIWIFKGYLNWISYGYQRICLGYHIRILVGYQLDTIWISELDIHWIFMDIHWIQCGYLKCIHNWISQGYLWDILEGYYKISLDIVWINSLDI